jgi:hypothetical protein
MRMLAEQPETPGSCFHLPPPEAMRGGRAGAAWGDLFCFHLGVEFFFFLLDILLYFIFFLTKNKRLYSMLEIVLMRVGEKHKIIHCRLAFDQEMSISA